MSAIIANLRSMQGLGIFTDRGVRSPAVGLRRFNLIYGFNGSGKSTLSRLFASLEAGTLHPKLPEGCSFEVELDDGTNFGCPSQPLGLERRLLVFNTDYIERNLQWATGLASPVFFIGADQADAAVELAKLEAEIVLQAVARKGAEDAERLADKGFANFKRDRAKLTAVHLHLGSRKYEAPTLSKDYDAWKSDGITTLPDAELKAAEDTRRLAEPMPRLESLEFDASTISTAYRFITEICGQSLTMVALEEVQRFPDMLLWLKHGYEFHTLNKLDDCLFCGNSISPERTALLRSAFDGQIDQFVARLAKTADRLQVVLSTLLRLEEAIPAVDALVTELRADFVATREGLVTRLGESRKHLGVLKEVLERKQERPASPTDLTQLADQSEVAAGSEALRQAMESVNAAIKKHNDAVADFNKHQERAELAIRKHFLADCQTDYANYAKELEDAKAKCISESEEFDRLNRAANQKRQQIKEHGPAAGAINKLIASYLGHGELSIHPVEQGYELHRHGDPIRGAPSEGEKTAIAISYFLSSIEAEGRKLKDMIVIVDDPVSSLDSKALNFACSLVRSRLGEVAQLFVLTHNLQATSKNSPFPAR